MKKTFFKKYRDRIRIFFSSLQIGHILTVLRAIKGFIILIFSKPIFYSIVTLILATPVVILLTIRYVEEAYQPEFIRDILVEAHGMLFDIIIIGIFIFALHSLVNNKRQRKSEIKRYQDEIDDFREWDSEEAVFRIVGNIRRLNRRGVSKIDLSNCYLQNAKLSNTNLEEANLRGAHFNKADLRGAKLKNAKVGGAHFIETDFTGTNLSGCVLTEANFEKAIFRDANLNKTDFGNYGGYWDKTEPSNLEKANLYDAKLQEANLRNVKLKGSDLRGANLENADLCGADLEGADAGSSIFRGLLDWKTNFKGARLYGVNLKGVKNLTAEQLSETEGLYGNSELDEPLKRDIMEQFPRLLEWPAEDDDVSEQNEENEG